MLYYYYYCLYLLKRELTRICANPVSANGCMKKTESVWTYQLIIDLQVSDFKFYEKTSFEWPLHLNAYRDVRFHIILFVQNPSK